MIIREYTPKDSAHAAWVRDVSATLNAAKTGFRWADQIGPVLSFAWNDATAPHDVLTKLTARPLAVVVLGATIGDGVFFSMCPIAWSWDSGTLTVIEIDSLNPGVDYTVTLGLVR